VNWSSYIAGVITGIPVTALAKYGFDAFLRRAGEQSEKRRTAARALIDATHELQEAAWLFASLHPPGVLMQARDLDNMEQKAVSQFSAAFKAFRQDYDLPASLAKAVRKELEGLDVLICNLKAFSVTGKYSDMIQTTKGIQQACQTIRETTKPYACGLWRRLRGIS
jgi:hypothetical protein